MRFLQIITSIFLLFFNSCKQPQTSIITEDHFENLGYYPTIISNNNIKVQICTEVISTRYSRDLRLRSKNFFDKNGYCYLKIVPQYFYKKNDTTGLSKLDFLQQQTYDYRTETSIIKYNDSTFYKFDNKKRLIEEIESSPSDANSQFILTTQYKYDNDSNLIELYTDSNEGASNRRYIRYQFNNKENSVDVIDSIYFADKKQPNVTIFKSTFLTNKRVNFNLNTFFEYNKMGKCIKKYEKYDKEENSLKKYIYDEDGKIILSNHKINDANNRTERRLYSDNKLLIQSIINSEYNDRGKTIKEEVTILKYSYK